jgi:NADH dehydrogenase (ubiquinone) 1 beta subcomplex subunit 9
MFALRVNTKKGLPIVFLQMAATALQKARVTSLYRASLKQLLSWVVSRDVFAKEAANIRAMFDSQKAEQDPGQIERLVEAGEERLKEYEHPDPYIVPYRPGGSLFARNPPFQAGHTIQLDFGRGETN